MRKLNPLSVYFYDNFRRIVLKVTVLQVVIWVDPLDGTYELVAAGGNMCKFYFHCHFHKIFPVLINNSSFPFICIM